MWHVDIVVDLAWFAEAKGKLGEPKSRATEILPDHGGDATFLLYGDAFAIRHLRILLHTESEDSAHLIMDANIQRWISLLEVASGLASPQTSSSASLGRDNNALMAILGEGDEHTDACQFDPVYAPLDTVNYEQAAQIMAAWQPDFRVHLFYLSRFLNQGLPPEVRWLNGYRVLEWHFRRGGAGLAKDAAYRTFLEQHDAGFDRFLAARQDRRGLIEQVRALAAHAIAVDAGNPNNEADPAHLITKTFGALEMLVMAIMNEGTGGRVSFFPKSAV